MRQVPHVHVLLWMLTWAAWDLRKSKWLAKSNAIILRLVGCPFSLACTIGGLWEYHVGPFTQAEDDMQVFRLAAIICLLTTLSVAQNVIDARGKSYTEIARYQARVEFSGNPREQKILSGIVTITGSTNLTPGSPFDYELLVTNDSNASVVIPQSFDWKEIDDGQARQSFVRATLLVQAECLKYTDDVLDHVVLYGSPEKPETEVTLKIGDSVRILGSGLVPLHPNLRCQSQAAAMVRVNFEVYGMTLKREPEPAIPDAYSMDEQLLVVANGRKQYPIIYPP